MILSFGLGAIIFGSIGVVATTYFSASQVSYTPADETWNVSNVEEATNSLYTDLKTGKELIANAITDKGITTLSTDSFKTMSDNINNITSTNYVLLWSRGSFESNVKDSGQTINLDLSNYDNVIIKMRVTTNSNDTNIRSVIIPVGNTETIGITDNTYATIPSSNFHVAVREFTINTSYIKWGEAKCYNSVSQGKSSANDRFETDNRHAFPIEIYGI